MRVHVRRRVQGVQRLVMSYEMRRGQRIAVRETALCFTRRVETESAEKSLLRSSAMSCHALFRLLPRLLIQRNALFA
jgi:hypothetical protein